jgi:hypothetical protein
MQKAQGMKITRLPATCPQMTPVEQHERSCVMALKIIYVTGTSNTGKSTTIREFTAMHLNYDRGEVGDVLGVFPMPHRNYVVGVSGGGDNLKAVQEGLQFLEGYDGLTAVIVACHERGKTLDEVESFAEKMGGTLHPVPTTKIVGDAKQRAGISANISKIMDLMPGRSRA